MSATLTLSHLDVAYGARTLVRGLDLVLSPGDVTALVGPNGSGKSSLMRTIVGELPVTGGSVRLAPSDATIGWLPQATPDPDESLLAYVRRRTGVAAAELALHVASEALADGGPAPTTTTRPHSSAGWRSAAPTSRTGSRRWPANCASTRHRTAPSARSPAARRRGPRWRRCCSAATTCCCSTSPPTTSTRTGCSWSRTS